MRLLIVKTSSLGDVIHALIPLTDAARAVPGLVCDWLVEEAYRDIPAWHPAVRRVMPCALRRWRKNIFHTLRSGEWPHFRENLRRESYDCVLDAQGLLKSAWLAHQARGPVAGRTFASAREGLASLFYDRRIPVNLQASEVGQLRELFSRALGYEPPRTPADFGLDIKRFTTDPAATPYVVLIHAAAWSSKLWPEDRWQVLGQYLRRHGLRAVLPWGTEAERATAQRLAAAFDGEVLPKLGLDELAQRLAGARCVVGLDTGLTHLAVALGQRTITLYGPSVPVFESLARGELINLCSSDSKTVDTRRPNTVPLQAVQEAVSRWLG
ncbi:MAG: lipopolysaccharide heptosyltransferase I [Nevskiales bacterium]|nr:lipopolysaccharide heptosyltransferase I [Nevskiales bacterium]